MNDFFTTNKRSIFGGLLTFLFLLIGIFLLGNVSGYKAKELIEASLSGVNMLCNTIVLGSATILTLLLTLLGISTSSKSTLKKAHYIQVSNIAKIDTVLFITALVLFQMFNIPITESEEVPTSWFKYLYWITLFFSSLISGMMVTVVLLLYSTVTNIISIVGLGKDHYLISEEEIEEKEEEEKEKN
ncbi:hypothetical protein DSM03_104143 [Leeuwenhoekiella aestuarii]|uniref:hypothetical protein n=1 Tax=Leeuwenhoekiella aestuarii TaxID=2249426 RepID=UPI000FFE7816|nr:hypothetical protein [Leeuwenhoekiella aestuarii]RXG14985.1 hypothetical protein DSM03_104143 [Leeuwenhoekiella aestuarii]